MPKDTFLNLDPEKRERFIQAAFKEFCLNDFRQASISQIVKDLGIAKGSVYQYFENKADLYLYLYELAQLKKAQYVQTVPLKEGQDFFEWMELLWVEGLKFDVENPLCTGFLFNVMNEKESVARGLVEKNRQLSEAFFNPLFKKLRDEGVFRNDVSIEFMVHFFTNSAQSLALYMLDIHEEEYRTKIKKGKPFLSIHQDALLKGSKELSILLRAAFMKK